MDLNIASSIINSLNLFLEYEKYFNADEIRKINLISLDNKLLNDINCDVKFGYLKDPSIKNLDQIQFKKGILGLALYRIANALIKLKEEKIAYHLHMLSTIKLNMDIDPRCNIDVGIYIDHGTGVVIGETVKIGSGVIIYHGVTLGSLKSNHKKNEKRHPTIDDNVTIGCYSMILGNIHVGHSTKIAAGSIVVKDLPTSTLYINNRESRRGLND